MRTLHRVLATVYKAWDEAEKLLYKGLDIYTVYLIDPATGHTIDKQSFDNHREAMTLVIESRGEGYTVTTDFESLV